MSVLIRNKTATKIFSQPGRLTSRLTVLNKRRNITSTKRQFGWVCRAAVDLLSPDELMQLYESVQKELQRLAHLKEAKPAKGLLLRAIEDQLEPLGFPKRPASQEEILQEVLEKSFQHRQALLADTLTAPQVASLLKTSRQTPLNRAEKGTLLAIYENGKWLFPRWQFHTQGTDGVLPDLAQVLRSLKVSPIEKLNWFVRPSPYLEERTPQIGRAHV